MEFPLPQMGEGLYEVELVRWLVKPGDAVARGQGLLEVLSDKATMEVPSPFAGTISSTDAVEGTKIRVGQVVLHYNTTGNGTAPASNTNSATNKPPAPPAVPAATPVTPAPTPPAPAPKSAAPSRIAVAAPSVRHLARKLGIDLLKVQGTGPAGRILMEDLTPMLKTRAATETKRTGTDVTRLDFGTAGSTIKLMGLRRKIAEKMLLSKRSIPHYSYIDECDLTDLVKLRSQLRDSAARAGAKLTYLAFFMKAVARALKDVPLANSTYDEATETITLHDRYHIGLAVAAPGGLIVPVVKDVDRRDLLSLAIEIDRVSEDDRQGRSRLEDLRGGTFTLTSVGGIGGLISTPIINHPEVGIMGIGKIQKRPVYDEHGQLRPADMVYLSFSFDHRIVDGAIGVAFGNAVIRHLQSPAVLLMPEPK